VTTLRSFKKVCSALQFHEDIEPMTTLGTRFNSPSLKVGLGCPLME
jgi:hypothetical protein